MGHAFQSPLRRWDVVTGLCQAINARTYVEVGCKEGRTVGHVLANCPNIQAVAIDPWAAQPQSATETYEDWDFKEIERLFWENVGMNKDRCSMRRQTSAQAASDLNDIVADVVFIDAAHDYDSVMADISLWWPKVRDGGFICGHDFQHTFPGVMRAVADQFPLMRVGVCPDSVWFVQKTAEMRATA
jgi:predicted O-methyltransferase YrrM